MVEVMPIASIKPKIIGLVLPGGRIQFFLQGTYSALVGKASRPSPTLCRFPGVDRSEWGRAPRAKVLSFHTLPIIQRHLFTAIVYPVLAKLESVAFCCFLAVKERSLDAFDLHNRAEATWTKYDALCIPLKARCKGWYG
jgi:hypothetical protein